MKKRKTGRVPEGKKCSKCKKLFYGAIEVLGRFCSSECSKEFYEKELAIPAPKKIPKSEIIKNTKKNKYISRLEAEVHRLTSQIKWEKKQQIKAIKIAEYKKDFKPSFYTTEAWRELRYKALKVYGRECALCHTEDGEMHVDHIKPRVMYPELELEFDNLQILCRSCNLGKSYKDQTDWRSHKKAIYE